jgi:hypothetical protein
MDVVSNVVKSSSVLPQRMMAALVTPAVLSLILLIVLFIWVSWIDKSWRKTYQNVYRRAKLHVHVNCDGLIVRSDIVDPYGILTGATYSGRESGCLPNHVDCHGKFYINLADGSEYDLKLAVITPVLDYGFVLLNDVDCTSVGFAPYRICHEGDDYEVKPKSHTYDMYIDITFDERAWE